MYIVKGININKQESELLCLTEKFETLDAAIKGAEQNRTGEIFAFEVTDENDFSILRNVEEILDAINKEFKETLEKNPDNFEGTMSYMMDCLLDDSFEEWHYLHSAAAFLSDTEINSLLAEHGDDDLAKCVNGKIVTNYDRY